MRSTVANVGLGSGHSRVGLRNGSVVVTMGAACLLSLHMLCFVRCVNDRQKALLYMGYRLF